MYDLKMAFDHYDHEGTGLISIPHFRNILHNFGFHKMQKRDVDTEISHTDKEFMKRNCVDLAFAKHVIAYRWFKQGREEEAKECFKVFDKKDRNTVSI